MKHFDEVSAVFQLIDDHFEQRMVDSLLTDDPALDFDVLARQQQINEQAYFVLLFSQLETEVISLCGELIGRMKGQSDWEAARAWKILDAKDGSRLTLMHRVALLTPSGETVYNRVQALYQTRSKIAHGNLLSEPLHLSQVVEEMQDIAAQLKGAL